MLEWLEIGDRWSLLMSVGFGVFCYFVVKGEQQVQVHLTR